MIDYQEKLKDPRWIERRDQILERDGHKCIFCGAKRFPLNVHHKIYYYDREPWEYEDHELVALCEDCHETIFQLKKMKKHFEYLIKESGWTKEFSNIIDCINFILEKME